MIQKIFEDLTKNNHVVVSACSIHDEDIPLHHGEINSIEIITHPNPIMDWTEEDVGKYYSQHSISGGKQEAAWNNYGEKYDNFIDALTSLICIEDVVSASSYNDLDELLRKEIGGF